MLETAKDILLTLCLLGIAALAIALVILSRYVKDHLQWESRDTTWQPARCIR